jgi:hypoxanthine phosphoribosyltransferase
MSVLVATVIPVNEETAGFQAYCGTERPRFVNRAELEVAKLLDFYRIPWQYEPHSFVLETDADGRVCEAARPDFYLPEQDLYLEITTMKQSLVTRKNRKIRKLRERYPEVKIKLFYKHDLERLVQKYGILEAHRRAADPADPDLAS